MLRSEYDFDVFHLRLSLVVIVALEVMIIWLGGEIKRLLTSHMLYGSQLSKARQPCRYRCVMYCTRPGKNCNGHFFIYTPPNSHSSRARAVYFA